jgi:hypothetical protein
MQVNLAFVDENEIYRANAPYSPPSETERLDTGGPRQTAIFQFCKTEVKQNYKTRDKVLSVWRDRESDSSAAIVSVHTVLSLSRTYVSVSPRADRARMMRRPSSRI